MPALPRLPTSFLRPDLEAAGFVGWRTWDELRADRFVQIRSGPGVYVIYRHSATDPEFLDVNPGGHFKRRDPTVDVAALEAKWVPGAHVVYIGKADVAAKRLKQFARFGAGEPIGHWGGRYIWQLADSDALLVAWHAITWSESPREYEKRLLALFGELGDGRRPFANLIG
jgi:hypothetical protein